MANKPASSNVVKVLFAVDRIEGSQAVMESDRGERITVSVRSIEPRPREGAIYRVPMDARGQPIWSAALHDPAEEARRRDALGKRMEKLRQSDSGGDLSL